MTLELVCPGLALRTEQPTSEIPTSEYVTLFHRGTLVHAGAQYRLVSRSKEAKWSAARLEQNRLSANFQGNPLWPQEVLSRYPLLLKHFSLEKNTNDFACILPMADTINSDLKKLGLHDFAFRNYNDYPLDSARKISARAYVDAFLDDGVLPMGELEDRDSIHDWSYHFVTFLFPEYLKSVRANLKHIRDHLSHFTGTTNYAWNYYGHHLDEQGKIKSHPVREELLHVEAVYRQMAIALDVATAKIVQLLGLEKRGLLAKCQGEIAAVAVYTQGVTREALAKILWLEPQLPASLIVNLKAESDRDILAYVHAQLSKHERSAGRLQTTDATAREDAFQRALMVLL